MGCALRSSGGANTEAIIRLAWSRIPGLAEMGRALVTLDELDRPTAGAGYEEWQGIVAHLGVLTPPPFRRRGFGVTAAAIAANDALDVGLVPQWRSRMENHASRSIARRLGFVEVGSQTTVLLTPSV